MVYFRGHGFFFHFLVIFLIIFVLVKIADFIGNIPFPATFLFRKRRGSDILKSLQEDIRPTVPALLEGMFEPGIHLGLHLIMHKIVGMTAL